MKQRVGTSQRGGSEPTTSQRGGSEPTTRQRGGSFENGLTTGDELMFYFFIPFSVLGLILIGFALAYYVHNMNPDIEKTTVWKYYGIFLGIFAIFYLLPLFLL
jgi:hypothetical protein